MVQVEMVELAMNLDFEKNYLAFQKKVVLFARPKMFYFTVLFWNVMFWNKTSGKVQKQRCQYKGWNAGTFSSHKPEGAEWGGKLICISIFISDNFAMSDRFHVASICWKHFSLTFVC